MDPDQPITPVQDEPDITPAPTEPQAEIIPEPPQSPVSPPEPPQSSIPNPQSNPPLPLSIVESLTDEQLKAAAALYSKKNQKALSQKGVEKRQAVASENIQNITAFINAHSPTTNASIARALNLPPRRVQHLTRLTQNAPVPDLPYSD